MPLTRPRRDACGPSPRDAPACNRLGASARSELTRQLLRLEDNAGVRRLVDEVRERPDTGLFGYDMKRQRVRRAYFSVRDPELRLQLIRVASEVEDRDRDDVARTLGRARAQYADALARAQRAAWPITLVIPLACLVAGYAIAGLPGGIGVLVAGFFASRAMSRRHRQHAQAGVARARAEVEAVQSLARRFSACPRLFDSRENAEGSENLDFGRQSAVANHLHASAAGEASRVASGGHRLATDGAAGVNRAA